MQNSIYTLKLIFFMTPKLQQWMPAIWIVLCVFGLMQTIDHQIDIARLPPTPSPNARYSSLRKFIPEQKIGYLVSAPPQSDLESLGFARAQYALIPHVLVTHKMPKYVLVDLQDRSERDSFLMLHSLTPLITTGDGVCLAERAPSHD